MMFKRRPPAALVLPVKKSDELLKPEQMKPSSSSTTSCGNLVRDHPGGKINPVRVLVLAGLLLVFFPLVSNATGKLLWAAFIKLSSYDSSGNFRRISMHAFYKILDLLDTQREVNFMNYGYKYNIDIDGDDSSKSQSVMFELDPADEPDRYCINMYHKIASAAGDLEGLEVLEVGSGRGGGASYIKRYLHPKTMTGLDFASNAVAYCQEKHSSKIPGLTFQHGDAEHLPFPDQSFDLVVNVESSHCYPHFKAFVKEVHRVLKPGGNFSWVDFREPDLLRACENDFREVGFQELSSDNVTPNVLAAMSLTGEQKKKLIDRRVPRFARHIFYNFAGTEGTKLYTHFANKELIYTHKLLQKK